MARRSLGFTADTGAIMEPTTTDKYIISLSGCRITCKYRQEPQVRISTMGPEGVKVERKPFTEVFKASVPPLFTATYSLKDGDFDVDLDCGAQRWAGSQGATEVRKALVRCGVTAEVAKRFIAEAVKAARSG